MVIAMRDDDGIVFADGRIQSAREYRARQSIERELAAIERDVMLFDAAIQWREARMWATPDEAERVFRRIEKSTSANAEVQKRQTVQLKYRVQHNARR